MHRVPIRSNETQKSTGAISHRMSSDVQTQPAVKVLAISHIINSLRICGKLAHSHESISHDTYFLGSQNAHHFILSVVTTAIPHFLAPEAISHKMTSLKIHAEI